jgi:uncharacterized protein YggE
MEKEKTMFRRVKVALAVALLAFALVACASVQAQPRDVQPAQEPPVAASTQSQRTITVVGVGKVSLVPDIARINVGAEARASSVAEAKANVDRQIDAIMAVLQELDIADKDIQTSHYGIYFEREPYPVAAREGGSSAEPEGAYRVSSMLEVTVRDVSQAGDVLDGVVEAGANQVYGVTFTVSDDSKWQSAARKSAVVDAEARAEELAGLTGVTLGEVLSVSEVIGNGPMPIAYAERAMGAGGIAPGELEMSTQVQVTFAIQ